MSGSWETSPQAAFAWTHLAYAECLLMGELWKISRRSSEVLLILQDTIAVLSITRAGPFIWKFNYMATDESSFAIGRSHVITEGADWLKHPIFLRDLCECTHAVFKLPPWYLTWGIIGSRHRVVDECVSVKQSHSNGHRPLTWNQTPLLSNAIMMQSL